MKDACESYGYELDNERFILKLGVRKKKVKEYNSKGSAVLFL